MLFLVTFGGIFRFTNIKIRWFLKKYSLHIHSYSLSTTHAYLIALLRNCFHNRRSLKFFGNFMLCFKHKKRFPCFSHFHNIWDYFSINLDLDLTHLVISFFPTFVAHLLLHTFFSCGIRTDNLPNLT